MSAPPPKDPRFRAYRAAAFGVYFAVVGFVSGAALLSAAHSVAKMTPPRLPRAEQVLTLRECVEEAQGLWKDLEREREQLVKNAPAPQVDQEWMRFRTGWMKQLRVSESHCAPESRERAGLKSLFGQLEQLQDLYTIHAVQYASEVGGAVEALEAAFVRAHQGEAKTPAGP